MMPARPSRLLKAWFARVVEGRILKTFTALRVRGLDNFRDAVARGPIVVVSNHTAWWDPMFCIYLSTRVVPLDGYAMMEAKNLRTMPFLGRLGGFGVELQDPEDRSEGLRYSADLLAGPGRGVWIFPQGRERPLAERPLGFRPGAAVVGSRVPGAQVVPVAFSYTFGHVERPFFDVSIGAPFPPDADVERGRLAQEAAVLAELDRIDRFLADRHAEPGFEVVLRRRPSWIARGFERALAWLTRFR